MKIFAPIKLSHVLIFFLLLIFPFQIFTQTTRLNLKRQYPILQAENRIWIGTPEGLVQYNFGDNSFKRYAIPSSCQNPTVRQLFFYDEWLWCVLDIGLAALHVRLNEWLFFDNNNGLPADEITGFAVLGDYVWIATNHGAGRYDLLIEEWEIYDTEKGLPEPALTDLVTFGGQVWFASGKTFSEYDPDFEKWRYFKIFSAPEAQIKRMFLFNDEIWLVTNQGLVRFNPQLQTEQLFFLPYLREDHLLEIFVEDENIWAITQSGLFYYDRKSGVWKEFEGNPYLKAVKLRDGIIDASEIWLVTEQNVLVYDRQGRSWEILDYASGLAGAEYVTVYSSGGLTFLISGKSIDYRTTAQEPWRKYLIEGKGIARGAGRNVLKSLFDNESGGKVDFGKYQWSLSGSRATFVADYEQKFYSQGESPDPVTQSGERLDLKSQLILGNAQTITGFYNNVDYSETMYGVRYRSREKGIVRELGWGDFRRESGTNPFGETASVFGANLWLQAGPKTERFKRSRITVKAQTGELRSRKTYQYFIGAVKDHQVVIRDVDYLKNQFFAVPGLDSLNVPENIYLYVDDLNAATNTPNTNEHSRIGGISGDFDLWRGTEDYYFDKKIGAIRFTRYLNPNWAVVVRYYLEDRLFEAVLQYNSVQSTALKNVYSLGGQGIIPYTFRLKITDASGELPLSSFRLDENGDGFVDSQWLDFENGLLFFPEAAPFPADVYDPVQPQSIYQMEVNFQTQYSLIRLDHRNLVRGSETLKLDGVVAIGGNDYVLDYTNGTLIFVREGILNPDTRIEIEYEYYLTDENEQIAGAAMNWSPSDHFYLQGDWLRFGETDSVDNLLSLHSEIRQKVGDYDIRFIPGMAYNTRADQISASSMAGYISTPKFRLQSAYQNFASGYDNLYRQQSVIGEVKSNLQISGQADVRDDLRLSGEWRRVTGFAGKEDFEPEDKYGNFSFLFHRKNFPGWRFSYQHFETHTGGRTAEKSFIQNLWEYFVPQNFIRKLGMKSLKMEGFLRFGRQTEQNNEQQFRQGYLRLYTLFSDRFQGSLFYRRNDLENAGGNKAPLSRSERLLFDLAHEQWRTIQLHFRIENNLSQNFHRNADLKDVNLRQFSQINLRFSPGRIWRVLSPLYFELNGNQSVYGLGTAGMSVASWVWQVFGDSYRQLNYAQYNRNYFLRNEFRPAPGWYLYSLIERNEQENSISSSRLKSQYWRWQEKLDLKLGFKTRLNVQYRQFYQDLGYQRTIRYFEPSAWLERRWTSDFQNIFILLYRQRKEQDQHIEDLTHHWESRCDLIWRKFQFWGIRRFEIRQSFSANYQHNQGYHAEKNYFFSSSSYFDVYPLHSMIFRLRLDFNQYIDDLYSGSDYYGFAGNLKVTFRF